MNYEEERKSLEKLLSLIRGLIEKKLIKIADRSQKLAYLENRLDDVFKFKSVREKLEKENKCNSNGR